MSGAGLGTLVVDHAGIVVRDFERAAGAFAALLGRPLPPIREYDPDDLRRREVAFRGAPIEGGTRATTFQMDNLGIDFLQPVGGASPWREFLDANGQGGDHLAFVVDDTERRVAALEAMGYEVLQSGRTGSGARYAYVATRVALGVDLEIIPGRPSHRQDTPPGRSARNVLTSARVAQLAYVVPDIETAAAAFARVLGVETPEVGNPLADPELVRRWHDYRGEPIAQGAGLKYAFFHLDNVDLELLQPVGGPTIWSEVLDAQGPLMHHLAFEVGDARRVLADLDARGYPTVQTATRPIGTPAGYADAREDLGVLLEILGAAPQAG